MTLRSFALPLALLSALCLTAPAWGVNKEMIELQTQVEQLQQQMTSMQRSFDERMGVMKNLVEQDTDAINKAAAALNALQATLQTNLQKQQGDSTSRLDQLSGQIQSLNDTLDELKVRLAKVSKQLEDMQSTQQNVRPSRRSSRPSNRLWPLRPRPTCSTTTAFAITTGPRTIWRRRNFLITSSFIPTPILPGTPTSIWRKFNTGKRTISRRCRTTIRCCRIFPAATRRHQPS